MFSPHTLLSLFLVTSTAVEAGLVSRNTGKVALRFLKRPDEHGSFNIVSIDRARVLAMSKAVPGVSIANGVSSYLADVWVGDPATNYSLIIDTGSANTWVGAGKPYVPTKTSQDTGKNFTVGYGSGNVTGEEWNDTVWLSPSLIIQNQGIGVAHSSNGFTGVDGILGLGPVDLTDHTVGGEDTIPTVMNNLFSQGEISEEAFGIFFVPGDDMTKKGELMFGGYDDCIISGPVTYVPLTKTRPTSFYWGIMQSISYGSEIIMQSGSGIVDTGTTLIYISSDAFEQYQSNTGGIYDPVTRLLKISSEQYSNLKPLTFNIGDAAYELTPNAQIWPRSLNNMIGGTADGIYLVVSDIGPLSSPGLDFVSGLVFLERFYSVYDATHGVVGFAKTNYTYADVK